MVFFILKAFIADRINMMKVGYLWRAVPMCATKKLCHATDLMWGRRKSKRLTSGDMGETERMNKTQNEGEKA